MKRSLFFARQGFHQIAVRRTCVLRTLAIGLLAIGGWIGGATICRGANLPAVTPAPTREPMSFKEIIRKTPTPVATPFPWVPIRRSATPTPTPTPTPEPTPATTPAKLVPVTAKTPLAAVADEQSPETEREAAQAKLAAAKKAEEDRKLAAAAKKKAEDDKKLAAAAAAKKAEDDKKLAAAAKKAEDDKKLAAAAKKAEEDKRLAAAKKAEEDKNLVAAVKKAEEDRKVAAAAKKAEDDKKLAAAAKKAEEDKQLAAAAKQAEAENQPATKAALAAAPSAESRAKLEQLIARSKDSAQVMALTLRLGDVDMALGDAGAAQLAYQIASGKSSTPETSRQASQKLAQAAAANGDFKTASSQWATLRMQTGNATEPRLLAAEAMALAAQQNYTDSDKLWAQFESTGAAAPAEIQAQALLGQGLAAELQGKADQARLLFRRVVKEFASAPQAASAQARLDDLKAPIIP